MAQDDILEKHRKLTNFLFNVDLFANVAGTAAKETASPGGSRLKFGASFFSTALFPSKYVGKAKDFVRYPSNTIEQR